MVGPHHASSITAVAAPLVTAGSDRKVLRTQRETWKAFVTAISRITGGEHA